MLTLYHILTYDTVVPHVSRIKLKKQTEQKLIQTLDLVFSKLSKLQDVDAFLLSLLTSTERIMLAKRLAVVVLLKEGYSDSDISRALNVTRVTVSRLQYFYEARGEGYELALKVIENEQLLTEFKDLLRELVLYAARAAGGRVKPTIL